MLVNVVMIKFMQSFIGKNKKAMQKDMMFCNSWN